MLYSLVSGAAQLIRRYVFAAAEQQLLVTALCLLTATLGDSHFVQMLLYSSGLY
jgi:hypothetical protein